MKKESKQRCRQQALARQRNSKKARRQGKTGKMAKRLRQEDCLRNQKDRKRDKVSRESRQGREYGKKADKTLGQVVH